ncbi:hypothetical protein [Kitasatospora herbaricolor]|uniref:ATP-binding protein n=1 Tax=Kitasatospora herbaricolor TaxID=68217 RepID=A0ABZ1WC85_9ACTN|nr:hypothetical protein [Kitasatospora herbaricolor]
MKQATLKVAGVAALGVAMAAAAAGTASAAPAATGGLGTPVGALTNPALTGAATNAVSSLPGGDRVASTVGTLAPSAGQAVPAAADAAPAPRAGLPAVPGLSSTPVGGLTGALGGAGLPGLGG